MNLYAAVAAQRSIGSRATSARARDARADEWMAAQGIVNPGAMARLIAPGFEDNDMWSRKRAGVTALLLIATGNWPAAASLAKNVVIITIDGFRW
jgi:hypothetical protein